MIIASMYLALSIAVSIAFPGVLLDFRSGCVGFLKTIDGAIMAIDGALTGRL